MADADPLSVPPAHEPALLEAAPSSPNLGVEGASTLPGSLPGSPPTPAAPPRVALLGATAVLSGFVFFQAPSLWSEWQGLRQDWEITRQTTPMGYSGISPSPSYATPPQPWVVERDDVILIWGGWDPSAGHTWFRVGRGDLDVANLARPMGRNVVRAIDHPLIEVGGGPFWQRLHHDTPVIGVRFGAESAAYPMLLLSKVEVINDTIDNRPVLLISTPFRTPEETVDIYDPMLNGERLLFGSSGLFIHPVERLPLLYDRDTESLWLVREDHQLVCVAGERKGTRLRHLERGRPVDWADWADAHPQSRLIVGANRDAPPTAPRVTTLPAG